MLLESIAIRNIVPAQHHPAAENEDTPFLSDVPERRQPWLAAIPGRGNVNLDAPGIERIAGQRHVIFPADQATNRPE